MFEDDAYLHEAVQPMHAQHLIAAAIAAADAAPQRSAPPLLYIGGCKPSCDADVVTGRDQTALAAGLPGELLRVGRCKAYCTHAYALSRGSARPFSTTCLAAATARAAAAPNAISTHAGWIGRCIGILSALVKRGL